MRPSSLVDLLRGHAARRPTRPALHYFDTTIGYGRLEAEAAALACGLQALGVARGDRVAVFLQNEPAAVVTHYGTWMAGGVVVPLNIMFKARELDYHLRDATVSGIVCHERDAAWVQGVAEAAGLRFLITVAPSQYLDPGKPWPEVVPPPGGAPPDPTLDLGALIARYAGLHPKPVAREPGDVAYLHYTSGTTGPPKGAMITHANVLFNAATYRRLCALSADDCVLGLAPLFHITGTIGHIAAAAYVGAPLVLLHRFHPAEAIRQTHARRATFTVGAITAFLALLGDRSFRRERLASLQKIFSGGAPVRPAVVERWEQATGSYIHNVWGMTETTSPGTWTPLGKRAPVDPETGALSVGPPIPGLDLKVVDVESNAPLAPGEIGELVVRGPNVFKGYWNRPEETAHALRDGWLYTGDLGKVDQAGWVYWIERKKDLINVSGFKVWPREVEEVLANHPAVQEVAVIGVPDAYRGEAVKAVVVLKPEFRGQLAGPALIAFCRERMATYKAPRVVELRDELPRNPQGKVLKYLLRG